ncbi:hypothetical protein J7I98_13870 [Streptomyces sp. ISL-98]|uniref:hypothetical protein n=1 Tax=Streptomyces sp. ISL-98 TaxID=2819192 RepID=UPI001BE696A9|nr:hypothetical protein [Streptomyces sp. ISL-98]MBT2506958.1 hypothetical protein [Streptomyces sp. ISL-98]
MAWDEWEQLKTEAAEKHSTQMRLNQLPASGGGGGGQGDLVVRDDELGRLGNMAYELREGLRVDGDHARKSTFDASIELMNDGLDTGSALTELHDAWNSQLGTLKEACAHISNHLDFTRAQHAKDEVKIQTELRNATGALMTVSRIQDYIK